MRFSLVSLEDKVGAELSVFPYWEEDKKPVPAFERQSAGIDPHFLSLLEKDFTAKSCEIFFSLTPDGGRVALLGLGAVAECDGMVLRRAFATLTEFCRSRKLGLVKVVFSQSMDSHEQAQAVLDGFSLANYSYDALKREKTKETPPFFVQEIYLAGWKKEYQELIDRHMPIMLAVNLTRDLVCGNADMVSANHLVEIAEKMADSSSATRCTVLRKESLEREGMGLLLAVNRGAEMDPALIVLNYQGCPEERDVTVVIGKGITFDTGGLNLKPTGSIETMRMDMAGAAAVLGVLQAAIALKLKKNVIGVIAAAENAINHRAYKPGDVYISHQGKSVEISNTDAEGRLVLADAISYVQKNYAPGRMIDLATLTGGIVVALGEEAAGLFCNDPHLSSLLKKAAEVTGERVWEMPLYPEYVKMLKSSVADIKNSSSTRKASPCTGAAFLSQFVKKEIPWAHLDIAGAAFLGEPTVCHPSCATGFGVKLLISLLEGL